MSLYEIDIAGWSTSYEIIMEEYNQEVSFKNNELVAYSIKNFLEILPTMVLLNKRNPEIYEHRCIHCKRILEA
jgi:hypothetical protein